MQRDAMSGGAQSVAEDAPENIDTHPGPARERSRVVVDRVSALDVADRNHARSHVGRESPISNGLTTVAGEMVE